MVYHEETPGSVMDNVLNKISKTKEKVNLGGYRATLLLAQNAFLRPFVW